MSAFNNTHATVPSVLRLGRGWFASPGTRQPEQQLHLYEFESCPFCRKVREVLCELDLAYVNHPCPKGSNNRDQVMAKGGKLQFPYFVDPNTGTEMYESEAIITYLLDTYGSGRSALGKVAAPLNTFGSALASVARSRGGRTEGAAATRTQPVEPLVLYNFEASPFCRKVRESLGTLNLDHVVANVARNGVRRAELVERGGKMMVPYLIDPNTGTEMYESDDIVAYLQQTYG